MIRQYITYRYKFNNNTNFDKSSPSGIFPFMFPEMKGVVTITDELLSDGQMKVLPNGECSAVRIGWVDIDETTLAMFGHTPEYVTEELVHSQTIKIYLDTKESLATFIRNYTTLVERTPNVFVLREASDFMGIITEELLLDLN